MPFLKGKYVAIDDPLDDVKPGEMIFTIKHTGEQFRSKSEYERRQAVYNEAIWTCRLTGHINLSHMDAWQSEQDKRRLLTSTFPSFAERTVLEATHHSTASLDHIVDVAWTKLQQEYQPGEPVELRVKASPSASANPDAKAIMGTIVKIDSYSQEPIAPVAAANGHASSPQSDKENKSKEANSPTKWTPPKLRSHKYSFKLDGEDKVINGVPAEDLHRPHKPPSKELVRLFIRASALRKNQNAAYVVDAPLVAKYQLTNKIPNLSPQKVKEDGIKALEEAYKSAASNSSKKRKRSSTGSKPPNKKAKLEKTEKKPEKKAEKKQTSKPQIKGQSKLNFKPDTPKVVNGISKKRDSSSSSEDSNSPLVKLTKKAKTENNSDLSDSSDSEDSDTPLAVIAKSPTKKPVTPKKATPKKSATPKKKQKDSRKKKKDVIEIDSDDSDVVLSKIAKTPTKSTPKNPAVEKVKKGRGRPAGSVNKTPEQKKKMKQMTLDDMKGKKGSKTKGSPSKSSSKATPKSPKKSPYKQPPLALRLQRTIRANPKSQVTFQLIARCARELKKVQLQNLPDSIKDVVMTKYNKLEEKKKIEKMTPEEREKYMAEKRDQARKKMIITQRKLNKRFEDTELVGLKNLPKPKVFITPPGLPNELFGDVAMVTEFIGCYKGLLMPDDKEEINSDSLMKALCGGKKGFEVLARVISVLMTTLLQDPITQDYQDMKVKLRDIPINQYTVCELVRLCLRRRDQLPTNAEDSDNDDESVIEDLEEEEVGELVEQLESCELYELEPVEKLKILLALCHRIMQSYAIQDYMQQIQDEAAQLWKKRNHALKIKNDQKREELKKKKEGPKPETKPEKDENNLIQSTVAKFYGVKPEDMSATNSEDGGNDLASVVKQRRVRTAQAAAEKERRDRVLRSEQKKQEDAERKRYEEQQFLKQFERGIALSRLVNRQSPIGCDRFHNRYWVFHNTTPGLYMEKGWAPKVMSYNVQSKRGDDSSSSEEDEQEESGSDGDEEDEDSIQLGKKGRRKARRFREKTAPKPGQNLWFLFDDVADIQKLCDNLHKQGIRESRLKKNLTEKLADVVAATKLRAKLNEEKESKKEPKAENEATTSEPMDVDSDDSDMKKDVKEEDVKTKNEQDEEEDLDPLTEAMRHELMDLELRVRHGGLGGVDDFTTWEKRCETAKEITDFSSLLKETQEHVLDKFIKGELAKTEKPKHKPRLVEEGEDKDGATEEVEEIRVGLNRWLEALEGCTTMSRLHMILAMFDSCIKWEKSAENAKCKICRKKGDEDRLLLCDECNQAFHLYCMRPSLLAIPQGDWFCPGCAPIDRRRAARSKNFRSLAGMDNNSSLDDDEENTSDAEEEEAQDDKCAVCGGDDEGLALCSTCPSVFHYDCHNPPLRHAPRSSWRCQQCTSGIRIRRKSSRAGAGSSRSRSKGKRGSSSKGSSSRARNGGRRRYQEEEEEDDEEEEVDTRRSARNRSTSRKRGYCYEDEDDFEEEEEEEEEDLTPRRASSRATKVNKKYVESEEEVDVEGENDDEESGEDDDDDDDDDDDETEPEEADSQEEMELSYTSSGRPTKVRVSSGGGDGRRQSAGAGDSRKQNGVAPKKSNKNTISEQLKHIPDILIKLRRNRFAWPFQDPVNANEVPDYYRIVTKPMDLSTMKSKAEAGEYTHPRQFVEDVAQIFDNAQMYNKPDSQVGRCVAPLEKQFCDLIGRFMPEHPYRRAENSPVPDTATAAAAQGDNSSLADHDYC